jgi:hypothetical protein
MFSAALVCGENEEEAGSGTSLMVKAPTPVIDDGAIVNGAG